MCYSAFLTRAVVLPLLVGFIFAISSAAFGDPSTTYEKCSPIINGGSGQTTINCPGIPESALVGLENDLTAAHLSADQAQEQVTLWTERYFDLSQKYERLALSGGAMSGGQIEAELANGNLDEAELTIADLQRRLDEQRQLYRQESKKSLDMLVALGVPPGGVISNRLWHSGSSVKICFMPSDSETRRYVAEIASQWTLYGNLQFDFGSTEELRTCRADDPSQVRIQLRQQYSSSYIGSAALAVPQDRPTMKLATPEVFEASPEIQFEILHEFGHMLGLYHVYQHPEFCKDAFDWPSIAESLGNVGVEQAKKVIVGSSFIGDQNAIVGKFDKTSVMQFNLPEKFYKGGKDNPCFSGVVTGLSGWDQLAMFRSYPYDPTEGVTPTAPNVDTPALLEEPDDPISIDLGTLVPPTDPDNDTE